MANLRRLAAATTLALGIVVFGGANVAFAGVLTGSNYNAACGGTGWAWTACVRPGGGQTVIVYGTGLSDCTAIVAMGGGWTGSVPVTPNGGGTSFSFVVPNDSSFWGWAEISGCTLDSSAVFLYQSPTYPRLDPDITVTGLDETLTAGETPVLDYSAPNAPSPSDWNTEPVCRAYLPWDLSTYVAGALDEGSYVIRCSDGVPVADADVVYVDGTITVNADSGGEGDGDGGGDSGGGTGGSTSSDGSELAATGVNSLSLIVAGMLGIAGIVGGSLLATRRSTSH